jgi:hypothetical protein
VPHRWVTGAFQQQVQPGAVEGLGHPIAEAVAVDDHEVGSPLPYLLSRCFPADHREGLMSVRLARAIMHWPTAELASVSPILSPGLSAVAIAHLRRWAETHRRTAA